MQKTDLIIQSTLAPGSKVRLGLYRDAEDEEPVEQEILDELEEEYFAEEPLEESDEWFFVWRRPAMTLKSLLSTILSSPQSFVIF